MRAYLIDNPFMNPVTEKLEVIILPSTLYEDITGYITQLLSKTNALSAQMQNQSKYPRIAPNPSEQAFLKQILAAIEKHMDNPDLSMPLLQAEIHISRSMLYRRVKALTGLSPSEFICNVRMKKAGSLLSERQYNISEVAYKVGFNDPRYFSQCFKKKFGKAPSTFRRCGIII